MAGVEYGDECLCGTMYRNNTAPPSIPASNCSFPCTGASALTCGGSYGAPPPSHPAERLRADARAAQRFSSIRRCKRAASARPFFSSISAQRTPLPASPSAYLPSPLWIPGSLGFIWCACILRAYEYHGGVPSSVIMGGVNIQSFETMSIAIMDMLRLKEAGKEDMRRTPSSMST
jgi:hypothetical protein